ncbi:MAG: 3-hydroxyacyl-ACP dehydratase FabZ [Nitrospina sp.]|jgi:3-hydroxyacyl-[acyl-carrier-protein] dehydratase|nr:3-hydroxyacyl-ACP dehydratase FabZ [Nitrospina sp.]
MDFLNYIPHRPPFLFVDRVLEEYEDTIKTEKRVDPEEPFFAGHYPGNPIMPGVLIFESIFQAGAIMMGKRIANKGRIPVLTRVNNIKLKHAVHPGDTMQIEVTLKDLVSNAAYMTGKATVNGKTAVTLEFTAMLVEETQ